MKKTILAVLLSFSVLTGCSAVEDVTNGINYVPEATEYINEVQQFSKEIPSLAEKAVSDQNARVELEKAFKEMNTTIEEFNELSPPSVFEDIHNQVMEHNQTFQDGIDKYQTAVENGELTPDFLEKSGLLDDVKVYTDLLNDIKQLGE
jgi:TolA-binding protein